MRNCVADIRHLLTPDNETELDATFDDLAADVTELWDGMAGRVIGGRNYGAPS